MEFIEIAAHESHPEHELELKHYQKPYTCSGCKEQGLGPRYRCESCDFDLHEQCMFTAVTTSHNFFPSSDTFKFLNNPPGKGLHTRYCDCCAQPVKGFVYHCEDKGWDLHPCCRNLKNEIDTVEGVKFKLRKVSSKCTWCKKRDVKGSVPKIRGWSYVSECKDYHFHVHCAVEIILEAWKDGENNKNDERSLALENLDLKVLAKRSRRNGRGSDHKFLKIVRIFLKTIACILLGDPTISLACLVFELVT